MSNKNNENELAQKMADLTFRLLDQCQAKQERIAENLGLTVAEFKILRAFEGNRTVTMGDLTRRAELSSSRMTRILDGMVKKKIVTRQAAADDRRVIEATLTERGVAIHRTLTDRHVRTHEEILRHLPPGTGPSVIVALEKLGEALKEWQDGAAGEPEEDDLEIPEEGIEP